MQITYIPTNFTKLCLEVYTEFRIYYRKNWVCYTDKATFDVSGNINRYNVRIWGREDPYAVIGFQRASPKLNAWWGLLHDRVIWPLFFDDPTITQANFLHLLQEEVYPQLRDREYGVVLQLEDAPPHWASLDEEFPNSSMIHPMTPSIS